jgi:hypothetical protein
MAKVKLALALAGVSVVHLDNLPDGGFYGSPELDSALTSTVVSDRILGQSRDSGPVPLRPVWFLSGNNLSPSTDAYRRWLPCNLASSLENPHEREDIELVDIRAHIAEHRADLLADALTILRAHAVAGRPVGWKAPLGSFEQWDQIVRGAVWYAMDADCLVTQQQATAESPDRLDKLAILEGWARLPGGATDGLTIDEALEMARPDDKGSSSYPELSNAFLRMSKDGKYATVRRVSYRFRALRGQNIGGRRLVKSGERNHSTLWRVEIS